MAKVLRCGELFPGRWVEARGESDDEIREGEGGDPPRVAATTRPGR